MGEKREAPIRRGSSDEGRRLSYGLRSEPSLDPVGHVVPVVLDLVRVRAAGTITAWGNSVRQTCSDDEFLVGALRVIHYIFFAVVDEVVRSHCGDEKRHLDLLKRA